MKQTTAANIALVLVLLGWALISWGVLSQLGDPRPDVPRAVMEAHRHVSAAVIFFGIVAIITSVWLSGYAFMVAKKRAVIVFLATLIPFAITYFYAFK